MKAFALVALLGLSGCASMWQSIKSAAAPAGGAAGGAALGSLAGPVGTIGGAAVGAIVGDQLEENASFRSGETIGEGALDKQVERWAIDYGKEKVARVQAKAGESWFQTLLWCGIGVFVLWLVWRNRKNFSDLGFWRGLAHSVLGGEVGK